MSDTRPAPESRPVAPELLHVDAATLRDYFAAQALIGLYAGRLPDARITPKSAAEFAYQVADAMLARRVQA